MGRAKRKKKVKEIDVKITMEDIVNSNARKKVKAKWTDHSDENQIAPKNADKNLLGTIKWPATEYSTEVVWFVEEATLLPGDIPVVNVYGNNTAHMIMTYPGLNPERARQLGNLLLDFANKHDLKMGAS